MSQERPEVGEVWSLHNAFEDGYSPLLILERDPDLPRWIACDDRGQKMGLWDCSLDRYHRVEYHVVNGRTSSGTINAHGCMRYRGGRVALAARARW